MPQENGNKTDVRCLTLTKQDGFGLWENGGHPIETRVSHFTADDFYGPLHSNDLKPSDEGIQKLYFHQPGLGGAGCGPGTLSQHLICPVVFNFGYIIQLLLAETTDESD